MTALQQQQQHHPQQQLQSPAQLGDGTHPGYSAAGSNQTPDLQAGPLGAASQQLTGHGLHSPTPNQSAAAEDGQTDPTPQHDTQSDHAGNSAKSTSNNATTEFGKATLSAEERDRLAAEWKANGKPSCPSCKKMHPPPCDTARVQELAGIKALRNNDPKAYKTQMAAFQAKYHRKEGTQSTQKRKAPSSNDADILDMDTPAKKGKRKKHSNADRGQLSAQQAQANLDRRVAEQRDRTAALTGQYITARFGRLMQQQGPWAGYNFLVGLYNGTVTRFPPEIQYPMPTYGYQVQPQQPMLSHGYHAQAQQPMPTYGYPAQPQQSMPTYGYPAPTYPASAYPNAQYQAPQVHHAQDTTPQPPMQYYGTACGVPPNTRYDARPTAPRDATDKA